jgi:hypothetical protein
MAALPLWIAVVWYLCWDPKSAKLSFFVLLLLLHLLLLVMARRTYPSVKTEKIKMISKTKTPNMIIYDCCIVHTSVSGNIILF